MKKILSLSLVILLMIPLFSGCEEPPPVSYTTQILINEETPPTDLVWYVELYSPDVGTTYAAFDMTEFSQIARRDYCDIIDYKYILYDNETKFQNRRSYTLEVLGMTEEEYSRKIKKYIDLYNFFYYPDRVIGVVYPTIYQGQTEETTDSEYSNKNILVDYDYKKTSVVIAYTDEELKAENGEMYSSNYVGRIGDRYYLPYGYYDLTNRSLCPYEDEDDLPPFKEPLGIKSQYELSKIIKNDIDASQYIPDYYYLDSYTLVGDRYYAAIKEGVRYSDDRDGDSGKNVFFVTVDTTTGSILYLQKVRLDNYWGSKYKLCSLGQDGILYDVMVP